MKIFNNPEDWLVSKNTHGAIIDDGTWKRYRIRDGKRRASRLGEMGMLSVMTFCADCGAKLYNVRGKGWTHDKEYMGYWYVLLIARKQVCAVSMRCAML